MDVPASDEGPNIAVSDCAPSTTRRATAADRLRASTQTATSYRGRDMTASTQLDAGKALGTDYLLLRSELNREEADYLDRTRRFVEDEVLPVMPGHWERAELPLDLARRLGELGLVGDGIEGYG